MCLIPIDIPSRTIYQHPIRPIVMKLSFCFIHSHLRFVLFKSSWNTENGERYLEPVDQKCFEYFCFNIWHWSHLLGRCWCQIQINCVMTFASLLLQYLFYGIIFSIGPRGNAASHGSMQGSTSATYTMQHRWGLSNWKFSIDCSDVFHQANWRNRVSKSLISNFDRIAELLELQNL